MLPGDPGRPGGRPVPAGRSDGDPSPLLRVVELCDESAAFAGRLLVGAGCQVTTVAVAGAKGWPAGPLDAMHLNAGKASVRVAAPDLPGMLGTLLVDADAFITGYPEATLKSWGVDTVALGLLHPRLVTVSVTAFGSSGPRRHWLGTDLTLSAVGGMMALCGDRDGEPLRAPREQVYHLGGATAAIATLLGVLARRRTHRGQRADISLQEVAASTLEYEVVAYIHQGTVIRRNGSRYPHVPHLIVETADGYVAGGFGGTERMWTGLLAWLTELRAADNLGHERWRDEKTRWEGRGHLFEVIGKAFSTMSTRDVASEATRRGLPWAAINHPRDVLADEQLRFRGFFGSTDPAGGVPQDAGLGFKTARQAARPLQSERATRPERQQLAGAPDKTGALAGVRVLDLTWVLAGPFATRLLADHGAEVIKIESHSRRDPTRYATAMRFSPMDGSDPDTSGYFANYNRNKLSILLNLKEKDAKTIALELVAHCDVLIENFSAGVLERLGLDDDSLRRSRPDLIVVRMSGVGQDGPSSSASTFADTLSAMSGMTAETAMPDGRPRGLTFGLGDMIAGYHAAAATLAALEHRHQTGEGAVIDLSQLECVASQMGASFLECQLGERQATAGPNTHPAHSPHGVFRCQGDDQWCAIAVTSNQAFVALCGVIGQPDLAADQRLATAAGRRSHGQRIRAAIEEWTLTVPAETAMRTLQEHAVAAGAVQGGRELVDADEQLRARGFYQRFEHPRLGRILHEGVAIRLSDSPGGIRKAAPLLGEDTDTVIGGLLGKDAATVARLRDHGVLG